ncbi:unnamed protein product [Alopecurus aequalis]
MPPRAGKPLMLSEYGQYTAWSGADQPELAAEGLGCGLHLIPILVLTMPCYADCPMIGYVLYGSGMAGVTPAGGNATEKLILLMADTAHAVIPGDITYFFLAGGNDVLRGLDAAAWAPAMTVEQATAAFRGQKDVLSTSTNRDTLQYLIHNITKDGRDGLVVNTKDVADAGAVKTVTGAGLGALRMSVVVGRLESGTACAPWVVRDGGAQAVYVDRGSARVQVSAAAGGDKLLLDEEVAAGDLFVVPRFAVASLTATGRDRLEWVSLIKSPTCAHDPVSNI